MDLRMHRRVYTRTPILWHSKMQKTTALSTAEAGYYSVSTAATEVLYLRYLVESMGFAQPSPTLVYEENTACIEWGNNVIGGGVRAKRIDIRKHFAHAVIQNGHMKLIRVATAQQLADILTQPLHFTQWQTCVGGILGKKIVFESGLGYAQGWGNVTDVIGIETIGIEAM
jgi:hypothetical protein